MKCEWCSDDAAWTVVSMWDDEYRTVCQRHYDDLERQRRAGIMGGLSDDALDLVREFHRGGKA